MSIQSFDSSTHTKNDIKQCETALDTIYEINKEYFEKIATKFGAKFKLMNVYLPKSIKETQ